MEITIYQVDAFSNRPFGGNPAGVVSDARVLSDTDMQNVAREMNLSETAFIIPIDDNNFKVRFFTPVSEVDLCGHATIGSFYTLAFKGYIRPISEGIKRIYQETKAGRLGVEIYFRDEKIEKVMMEQAIPEDLGYVDDMELLLSCFNVREEDIGIGEKFVNPKIISTGLPDIILPIRDKGVLDNLEVDFNRLKEVSKSLNAVGVHVFYLPKIDADRVYTRNFAPLLGINEEAATGTANGALIYFLKKGNYIRKNEIVSIQGEYLGRPSEIYCSIEDENGIYKIKVGGQARIVLEGIMCF